MVAEQNAQHQMLASDVRAELARHGILIKDLAKEVNRTRTTVNLWLLNNTTQQRYDMMMAAISRIISKDTL